MIIGPLDCFPDLEALEPHLDIHALFLHYADLYFGGGLGACSVEWSSRRMTSCGGVCEFRGGGCTIKLSEPLLKVDGWQGGLGQVIFFMLLYRCKKRSMTPLCSFVPLRTSRMCCCTR